MKNKKQNRKAHIINGKINKINLERDIEQIYQQKYQEIQQAVKELTNSKGKNSYLTNQIRELMEEVKVLEKQIEQNAYIITK